MFGGRTMTLRSRFKVALRLQKGLRPLVPSMVCEICGNPDDGHSLRALQPDQNTSSPYPPLKADAFLKFNHPVP